MSQHQRVGKERYKEWADEAESILRQMGEPLTTRQLRDLAGLNDRQQASHLAVLVRAGEDRNCNIVWLGYRAGEGAGHGQSMAGKLWGLREWKLPKEGMQHAKRTEKRLETFYANRATQQQLQEQRRKKWREDRAARRTPKEDTRENGKAGTPSQETSTVLITLGEHYRCTGVALEPDGTVVMTLTAEDGKEVRVVQQEG